MRRISRRGVLGAVKLIPVNIRWLSHGSSGFAQPSGTPQGLAAIGPLQQHAGLAHNAVICQIKQ
jgi:hypothetical protein